VPKKLTIGQVRQEFLCKGYELLTAEYVGSRQRFKYRCDKGHVSYIRLDHLRDGIGCSACSGNRLLTIEYIRDKFFSEGYKLVTDEYINSKTDLEFICPNDHEGIMTWNNWRTGYRCLECAGTKKYSIECVRTDINKYGYKLLTTKYVNNKTKLKLMCPNDHLYYVTWDNWHSKKSRCPKCKNVGTSGAEDELYTFIKSICNNAVRNDRTIISPYELDVVIKDKKIAIEYCGLYWHSECRGKDNNYHLNKLDMCNDVNYRLITIFEDEWISKKHIVKSNIKNILLKKYSDITVDDCIVRVIGAVEALSFCKRNFMCKMSTNDYIVGAFYNEELIAIMGFCKKFKFNWKLSLFCNKVGCNVKNIQRFLLAYFEKSVSWFTIFTTVDRRWSCVNDYVCLGFVQCEIIKPAYWLFKNNRARFCNNSYYYQLTNHCKEKAEVFNKIWDCGQIEFKKEKVCDLGMIPHHS